MQGLASRTLFVVQADPPIEREAEFHQWYDEVHGPDAIGVGSFTRMSRYRAVGPGRPFAPFIALWDGNYADEAEAWGYIRPRAHALNDAGRVGDIASVRFALMMFLVRSGGAGAATAPVRSLTTVQNDWRAAEAAEPADRWWRRVGLDGAPPSSFRYLYSSDPAGRGPGYHLAVFEQAWTPDEAASAWPAIGTAGSSPTPPYRTIFTDPDAPVSAATDQRAPADAWVMHWEPLSVLP
jgi:hypothetical protein